MSVNLHASLLWRSELIYNNLQAKHSWWSGTDTHIIAVYFELSYSGIHTHMCSYVKFADLKYLKKVHVSVNIHASLLRRSELLSNNLQAQHLWWSGTDTHIIVFVMELPYSGIHTCTCSSVSFTDLKCQKKYLSIFKPVCCGGVNYL